MKSLKSIYTTQENDSPSAGDITIVSSLFLIGPGVPLWIVGGQGESKYRKKFRAISFTPRMNKKGVAVALTYKF